MRKGRRRLAEGVVEQDLLRRVRDVIVAAHDVRDGHIDVVDDYRQVIRRMRIGSKDDEVLDVLVVELDWSMHAVGKRGLARRHLEANRAFVEHRLAAIQQLLSRGAIAIEPLGLKVRRVRAANLRPFVPIDAQPPQSIEDTGDHFGLVTLDVGVLNAQDERAAVAARIEPIEQGSPGATNMKITGGGRGETETGNHLKVILSAGELSAEVAARLQAADQLNGNCGAVSRAL